MDEAKDIVAKKVVEEYVKDGMTIGIGSGTTLIKVIEEIALKIKKENIKIKCIPTSDQVYLLLNKLNIPIINYKNDIVVDITIDGADYIDNDLNCIKGGGGCLLKEKIVGTYTKKFIIVADSSKRVSDFSKLKIPLEVHPFAYYPIYEKLIEMDSDPVLRIGTGKLGPIITDNGNYIIDATFRNVPGSDLNPLNNDLKKLPGFIRNWYIY